MRRGPVQATGDMTVVFNAGQNCRQRLRTWPPAGWHYIGSVQARDCPELTRCPHPGAAWGHKERFGGLTAFDTRREVYGASAAPS